jgi:uncharacterized protein YbjT (DUF2867 family)
MRIVVIGGTGTVGTPMVRALLERGASVRVYVRDEERARRRLRVPDGTPGSLHIMPGRLDDAAAVETALTSMDVGFIALGPWGEQGALQREVIETAGRAKLPQLVRLSVLSTGHRSLGVNQRSHATLDDIVLRSGLPYTSLRPALFSTSVLDVADQIRTTGGWSGGSAHGRNPFIDPRDVAATAAAVLLDETTWGRHHELTGPALHSWPEVATLLTQELGEPVSFRPVNDDTLRAISQDRGLPPAIADMMVAREHAIEAGENERLTDTVARLTGSVPRPLSDYLHEHRAAFLRAKTSA